MSRHRFVRNLDLEDEMNDEEDDTGMSAEEAAQMSTALPIARTLLKDLRPPISDDAIADSLWHYWFDVEKAVAWIRQDREKKGEAPSAELVPTPEQRPRKRRRGPLAGPSQDQSLQMPLTALQRLSLSRKQASPVSPSSSISTSLKTDEPPSKPMSKLALLAQKRREAAQGLQSTISSTPAPTQPSTPAEPSPGLSAPVGEPTKPLSKLAQKMAAARAAREEAAAKVPTPTIASDASLNLDVSRSECALPDDSQSDLFRGDTSPIPSKPKPPSTFFSIITSTAPGDLNMSGDAHSAATSVTSLHVPLVTDIATLTKRFEQAFAESPDEVVLRKRQGRAGTADLATAVKKQAKGTGAKPS